MSHSTKGNLEKQKNIFQLTLSIQLNNKLLNIHSVVPNMKSLHIATVFGIYKMK